MEQKSFFASSRTFSVLTLILLYSVALSIRVYDIKDLPLDFHPTRQLFSAAKARGMYYEGRTDVPEWQREFAVQHWKTKVTIEPEILERTAAFLYRFTGERLWVPRLISALLWLVGGAFIYLLARDLVSVDGGVLALAFFLLVPYGIYASRSFQPDPLMVVLIVAFWWLIIRWVNKPSWRIAILAGLVGGLAVFVKFVAAFFVIGGVLGALFGRFKLHDLIRNPKVWVMAVLGVIPGAAWFAYGRIVLGLFGGDLSGRFIPSLLVDPIFYLGWQAKGAAVAGGIGIMLGLLGIVIGREQILRSFLLGIWGAYLVFGIYFNYHISTHDYYSLPLVGIVALSLAPVGDWFFARLKEAGSSPEKEALWIRSTVILILLYGIFATIWNVRNQMKAVDYRPQEAYWAEISQALGENASVVALTQDYGNRLSYWGWQNAVIWPSFGDLNQASLRGNPRDIDALFEEMVASKTYFLVTDMADFQKQPDLQMRLEDYKIVAQDESYLIYDLQSPLETDP